MNKLELAHQMALAMQSREPIVDMKLVATLCFDYAEAMLAEDEKRKDKSLPMAIQQTFIDGIEQTRYAPDHFEVDWSQAPSWANWWCFSPIDNQGWWSKSKPLRLVESWAFEFNVECSRSDGFGYEGDWRQSLRKRPE